MSAEISIVFERTHGVRQIMAPGGESITSISQPSWPEFMQSLGHVTSGEEVGSFITTPELMTSADIDLATIPQSRGRIEDRIGEATELTRQTPHATLLLGSVVFDPSVEKPRNAVLFLRNGLEVGRTHKVFSFNRLEREHLHTMPRPALEVAKPAPGVANIICSDIVMPPPIDTDVSVLLVSGCWGAPAELSWGAPSPDRPRVEHLERVTRGLFSQYDNLQTIAMTDRLPAGSPLSGPFNFVAQRQS